MFDPDFNCMSYSMILKMFVGSLLEVMMVVTPAAVAISAAMSFVSIPPVPKLDPRVVVLTRYQGQDAVFTQEDDGSPCDRIASMEETTSIRAASGSFLGLDVYSPSTSVSKKR